MHCISSPAVVSVMEHWVPSRGFAGYRVTRHWAELKRQHCTYACPHCNQHVDIEVEELHADYDDDGPW